MVIRKLETEGNIPMYGCSELYEKEELNSTKDWQVYQIEKKVLNSNSLFFELWDKIILKMLSKEQNSVLIIRYAGFSPVINKVLEKLEQNKVDFKFVPESLSKKVGLAKIYLSVEITSWNQIPELKQLTGDNVEFHAAIVNKKNSEELFKLWSGDDKDEYSCDILISAIKQSSIFIESDHNTFLVIKDNKSKISWSDFDVLNQQG